MPNSKMKNIARKHRKARQRWKAKHKESLSKAKDRTPKPRKKISVFERAKMAQTETTPLSGASPSAVSNPTGESPRTASMMTFHDLKKNGG
jgi:hypothetical protein